MGSRPADLTILETGRLVLRQFVPDDAAFIVELLNEPAWLRFIGDRGVRTLDDARGYLARGPQAMHDRHGFSLYHTALKADGTPVGMCGLIKRDTLPDVDIGFAFLARHWGYGYAQESSRAMLTRGFTFHGLQRIVAITSPDNIGSIRVLEKIGFAFEKRLCLPGETRETLLYGTGGAGPGG